MMTVHKLTAGKGYTYLTRQVASADEPRPARQALADYYTARGNPPGVWLGGGSEALGVAGDAVSEGQMRALFGSGLHPNAKAMLAAGNPQRHTRLGPAYPTYADLAPYADRLNRRIEEFTTLNGRTPSPAERNGMAANEARRGRRAVAGFDLVFSPVKSVSVLWALGGAEIRHEIEEAHHAAVGNVVGWIEKHAAFTRTGHGGAAQVDSDGLVCAAFDHRESRTGDPDLHTHVAVANKVRGVDGRWRSLDARGLFALGVAASERYNTRVEDDVARRLGVRFEERPGGRLGKRPVREVAGVPARLIEHFSRRRSMIEARLVELRREYRNVHGHEPGRAAQLQLAQQATLETREGKGPGRTLAEQLADWTRQAREVVGERRLRDLVRECTGYRPSPHPPGLADVYELATRVVRSVAEQRATWTVWNVYAETERVTRSMGVRTARNRDRLVEDVVTEATGPSLSIRISEPEMIREPAELVRESDGQSVFVPHGSERFTTSAVLLAEDRLVDAGRTSGAQHLDEIVLEAALAIEESRSGVRLDEGQRDLVRRFTASPHGLAVGIGPAGAGKTTAMRAVVEAWRADGGRVVALASSSKAAEVLGSELGLRAENLHKFLFENARSAAPIDEWFTLRPGDLVIVDEAGMAGTLQLDRLLQLATAAGAPVRLLGDPAQLASVEAGGALRLLEREIGAAYLTELHRFADPHEAAATLQLRQGDPAAIDFYAERGRIHSGPRDAMLTTAYDAWASDVRAGMTSVLIAGTSEDVTVLNAKARTERIDTGDVEPDGVVLHDGNLAGTGDWVLTRANARTLSFGHGSWVRNGDAWRVVRRHRNGALSVRLLSGRGRVTLPAEYVADSVELGYAVTAHRAQGTTTDTAHALVTNELSREALYVASTRGRSGTTWYAATDQPIELDCATEPESPMTPREMLAGVLARTNLENSARDTISRVVEDATSLSTLVTRYQHAWTQAAHESLRLACESLTVQLRRTVVDGPGASYLACVLGRAAAKGADIRHLLTDAVALDDLDHVRSPALVLATRIEDQRQLLGIPAGSPPDAPLPWLPAPDVGHPGWLPYLRQRTALISERAQELGSLAAAYREQYAVTDRGRSLGVPPAPGSRREVAYRLALRQGQELEPSVRAPATPPPRQEERGPQLSR